MGFYADRVVPHIVDKACGVKNLRPLRARACAGLTGDVVELGFGSGLNVEHYPETRRARRSSPARSRWASPSSPGSE